MNKIFLIILMLFFVSVSVFAQDLYNVKLGSKFLSVSTCIKQGDSYYVSQDIFKALNLSYEAKENGDILIKDTTYAITPKNMAGMYFIDLKDIEKATESILEINDSKKEAVFWNRIRGFSIYDDVFEIRLSFPVKTSTFIWNNKLIFDFEITKDSGFPDYKCDESEKIDTVRYGVQADNAARIVCDLLVEAKNTAKTDKYETVIRYNLKSFIVPEVIKIEDVLLGYDNKNVPVVTLVGGVYANPAVSCNVATGNYTIKIKDGIIKDTKIKRFATGVSLRVSDTRTILLDVNQIYSTKIEKINKDLRISFIPVAKPSIKDMTVVLDAGHGGNDVGATYGGAREKDLNLKFILKVAEYLREAGVKVILARSGDTYLSLSERGQIAIDENADLFISIHCNSSGKPDSSSGIETYYHKDMTTSKYLGNIFHSYLVRGNKLSDRGVKSDTKLYQSGLGVLRKASSGDVPGILIETGFINHSKDRSALQSEEYQRKIASDILETVKAYSTGKTLSDLNLVK